MAIIKKVKVDNNTVFYHQKKIFKCILYENGKRQK